MNPKKELLWSLWVFARDPTKLRRSEGTRKDPPKNPNLESFRPEPQVPLQGFQLDKGPSTNENKQGFPAETVKANLCLMSSWSLCGWLILLLPRPPGGSRK